MQVNFETNNYSHKQNFGNSKVTEEAVRHLKSRFMTSKDMDRFEKVIERFNKKGAFIEGELDENHGSLTASIFSQGRHFENMTEGTFSRLFLSPIHFLEKWADRADKVEEKLMNDVKLENIAKKVQSDFE